MPRKKKPEVEEEPIVTEPAIETEPIEETVLEMNDPILEEPTVEEPAPAVTASLEMLEDMILKYYKQMKTGESVTNLELMKQFDYEDIPTFNHLLHDLVAQGKLPRFSVKGDGSKFRLYLVKR
jgi:hypothetical protein